ncbi:MAG: methanol:corrinoid methyltransferase [Anaerosporomusa subterranea]|nr:methanol:corrinoid methyltransferase [Anaerosporomusa subterranea]
MKKVNFTQLVYTDLDEFIYGSALRPVACRNGLVIGGGRILPEINFTLPDMLITKTTMPDVLRQYKEIVEGACKRAKELETPGLVVELELLPPATYHPEWGVEITKVVRNIMNDYEQKHGLHSVLRITPVDIREDKRSPHMWRGSHWDAIMQTFAGCAKEGAELLSIESIGGKDIHDDAVMYCDIVKSLFALSVLGTRDMAKLWDSIVRIAAETGTIPAGDTACGFGNTAMVLADKRYLPKTFAAVVRVMTVVRSLVALERGAVGPHKDCGYEGVYIKAITGTPIAMEGKSSACAHLSHVGNIAAASADLWSNESVQNIKLLGGMAPTVSLEQLIYDCRLMNTAAKSGISHARLLRDWLTDSDSVLDPQAYVLRPDVAFRISQAIVQGGSHFERTKIAGLAAVNELKQAANAGNLIIDPKEIKWLDKIQAQLSKVTNDEEAFIREMTESCKSEKFDPAKYDLK